MGWFDEQIRERIQQDNDAFADSLHGMAGVVMGTKISRAMEDDRIRAKNAIDEVLKFYHVKPMELPDNIREMDEQMEYLMRPSGIMRRTVYLKDEWYKDAVGAMMGVLKKDGSVVALIPATKGSGYTFYDADSGKRVKVNKQTAGLLEMEGICFYKPLPLHSIGIKELLVYMTQCISASDYVSIILETFGVSVIGMLIPKLNNLIYAHVISSGSMQAMFAVFGFLISVMLSQAMLGITKQLLVSRIGTKVEVRVQAAVMMRMLSLPASFFKGYASGDLAARMNYVSVLCTGLLNVLLTTGLGSIFSLIYIFQMTSYAPGLVIPSMTVILFSVVFSVISTLLQMHISLRQMEFSTKESGLDYALITGVQKIKLAGAEKRAFAKWANLYQKAAKLQYDPPLFLKITPVVSTCMTLVGTIVMYYFAITTKVALADYFAFNAAYGMVMAAFTMLTGMVQTIAQVKPILEMIKPILHAVPEITTSKKVVTRLTGGVELNNVSFRYVENMPNVIDKVSLKIRPGQYVAIVGQTGCGKSTLMRLMLGFETAQKGAVYYDGQDINSLDLKSLRRRIGTVMQDGKLFQGDIFSNIAITSPSLTQEQAWQAAEMAGIAEDIKAMPMGMHTLISEGSGGVSGGQRQRLMIARAIAGKPKILMFDEATSALDNLTQKTVSDSLESLKCTRIVIAHRLSTIRNCDRIIVLDKGTIIEDGTYEELIAKKGFFAELVARQQLEVK